MITFINSLTGTEMLVADDRKDEYLAAGHTLAATPLEGKPAQAEEPKSEKTTRRKKR